MKHVHTAKNVLGCESDEDDIRRGPAGLVMIAEICLIQPIAVHAKVEHLEVAIGLLHARRPDLIVVQPATAPGERVAERPDARNAGPRLPRVLMGSAQAAAVLAHTIG